LKILIIDDDDRIRVMYSELLNSEGYETIQAANASEGYEIFEKENVALVLLDIKMPDNSVDAVHKIMRSFLEEVKVIIASVYPIDIQKQKVPGATDYYDKSQSIGSLLDKIDNILASD